MGVRAAPASIRGSRPGFSFSAERLCWRERCLQAGAVRAALAFSAPDECEVREARAVTAPQRCVTQRHIVRPFIPR